MDKGSDQGDFEVPGIDTEPGELPVETTVPTRGVGTDPDTGVVVPEPPQEGLLPTTSGDAMVASAGLLIAVALAAVGVALAVQRRYRPHW